MPSAQASNITFQHLLDRKAEIVREIGSGLSMPLLTDISRDRHGRAGTQNEQQSGLMENGEWFHGTCTNRAFPTLFGFTGFPPGISRSTECRPDRRQETRSCGLHVYPLAKVIRLEAGAARSTLYIDS